MKRTMKNRFGFRWVIAGNRFCLSAAILAFGAIALAAADVNPIDVSGYWIITFTSPNGDKIESQMKLKQDGDKLTGVSARQNGMPSPIENGTIKDDEISFTVSGQRNGRTFTSKYSGKLVGETIKGKFEGNFGGQARTTSFEAVRDKPPVGVSGNWRWSFTRDDGEKMDFTLRLKEENGSLTGVSVSPSGKEMPISEAVAQGDEVSFNVIRERDDRTLTMKFQGKREDNTIKGKVLTDWSGEMRANDWEAKRVIRRRLL